jgi:Protein of unknown function (DUF3558)
MPARRHTLTSALLIATLAAGAAACSSSGSKGAAKSGSDSPKSTGSQVSGTGVVNAPSGGSDSDGPNPCTIVSAADITAITGAAATPAGPKRENRGRQCTWHPGNGASVLVQVYQGKQFYDPSMQAPSAKKLTGLGDDAYLDDFGTTRTAVGFLKGDTAVFIDGFAIKSSDAVVAAARDAVKNV